MRHRSFIVGVVTLAALVLARVGTAQPAPQLVETGANTAVGQIALASNTTGSYNTASGYGALGANGTGNANTPSGYSALASNTTGIRNTASGYFAGLLATTGSYNVFLGADVIGTGADTNTMRLGLPYNSGTGAGQTRTFIAGIHGTQLTGPTYQVVVDANGQLGTVTPPVQLSGGATATPLSVLQQQVEQQQAVNAELRETIADLRARLARLEGASPRRR